MQENFISVKQLNLYARALLEGDSRLADITVVGELSNFKNHYSSGHWYFTLKDNEASIRCVMFKFNAQRVNFTPKDGVKVILRGRVSIYEKDGQYQFYAEQMLAYGMGDIALKFEQTKLKLMDEGLFDIDSKRKIPEFPNRIAVMTSPTGAAVKDILNILSRRWPIAEVVMCPVSVQGELAVKEMLNMLDRLYQLNGIDLLIIGRGGGSVEDLWCFNEEALARKLYQSPFPVISAVGHETDFTICDFVADLRAPTPSAAAELAVPDFYEITQLVNRSIKTLKNSLNSKYLLCEARLNTVRSSNYFKNPVEAFVERNFQFVDNLSEQLTDNMFENYNSKKEDFLNTIATLDALSPLKTISRGFAAVKSNEKTVFSVKAIKNDDIINLRFTDGEADCRVIKTLKYLE